MHTYVTSPDLDRLIARRHGTRPGPHDMNDASRTAGCPAAERKTRTEPTGGASPIFTSVEVKSPLAQLRHQGRAVPLKRRRTVRDDFLGREGKPSQSLLRKVQRQTLYTCLVQLACGVDASIPNESLAPVRRASSAMSNEKNWIIQSRSGVCPLDIRDHIPVRRKLLTIPLSSLRFPELPRFGCLPLPAPRGGPTTASLPRLDDAHRSPHTEH